MTINHHFLAEVTPRRASQAVPKAFALQTCENQKVKQGRGGAGGQCSSSPTFLKFQISNFRFQTSGFTLVEMLIVIAIISVLAGFLMSAANRATDSGKRRRVESQLAQIETAIETYHAKYGTYPPDCPQTGPDANKGQFEAHSDPNQPCVGIYQAVPNLNQLYYELSGTVWVQNGGWECRDVHDEKIDFSVLPGIQGIVHSSTNVNRMPVNFFGKEMKTAEISRDNAKGVFKMLAVPVEWPGNYQHPPILIPNKRNLNVWRYNSSNPIHNKNSYDLWAVIVMNGKEISINNWERRK